MGRGPSPGGSTPISARLGGGEGLWPTLLGTLEGPSRRRDPLEGGGPLRGGKAAAVTKLDVKARETQVAVVPPRPSPPPPCQSLTRASSWTACAWRETVMRSGSAHVGFERIDAFGHTRRRRPRRAVRVASRGGRTVWRPARDATRVQALCCRPTRMHVASVVRLVRRRAVRGRHIAVRTWCQYSISL